MTTVKLSERVMEFLDYQAQNFPGLECYELGYQIDGDGYVDLKKLSWATHQWLMNFAIPEADEKLYLFHCYGAEKDKVTVYGMGSTVEEAIANAELEEKGLELAGMIVWN